MSKFINVILVSVLLSAASLTAGDLYRAGVQNDNEAMALENVGVIPVLRIAGGYVVLADDSQAEFLSGNLTSFELIKKDIALEDLVVDHRPAFEAQNDSRIVFDNGQYRLLRLEPGQDKALADGSTFIPLRNELIVFEYDPPQYLNTGNIFGTHDLEDIIAEVSQDSLESYLETLQSYMVRLAGTTQNYAARDWLVSKFQSFGYTNVTTDLFQSYVYDDYYNCYNVICSKTGTVYPDRQIVIGAHYDAVPGSPGADDNGTGSAAVLEIARVLAEVDLDMTVIFILFDSEEQGLNGSYDYAYNASYAGDSIICMLNMDMIGNYENTDRASIYYGTQTAYAELWGILSDSLVNITAINSGQSSSSDHYYFAQFGYDVCFSIEYIFSPVYHSYRDSTTYVGYDYFTRMAKATLATAHVINEAPLSVEIAQIWDVGDGQSMLVLWDAVNPAEYDHIVVCAESESPYSLVTTEVPAGQNSVTIDGLVDGREYAFYIIVYDTEGDGSIIHYRQYATPYNIPPAPGDALAMPVYRGIRLDWETYSEPILDFDHFKIIRDGVLLPDEVADTFFVDDDFSLGYNIHQYYIVACDMDGNRSDTTGTTVLSARAASLQPGRILAVNRSCEKNYVLVDEGLTGELLNEALTGYDYLYYSDTNYCGSNRPDTLNLNDLLDYELVIFGCESARIDDLAREVMYGGILDTIGYYLSIGGKAIVFGRWGEIKTSGDTYKLVYYNDPDTYTFNWRRYFHIDYRILPLTEYTTEALYSDFVGASPQVTGYPELVWDSLAAVAHSNDLWDEVSGIPCPSLLSPISTDPELIYTYVSRDGTGYDGGKVGWRYLGEDYSYILLDIPLSFMERTAAVATLQQAVSDMSLSASPGITIIDPDIIETESAPPTSVTIYLGNFMTGKFAADVNTATLAINESITPLSTEILSSHPSFDAEVLTLTVDGTAFIESYGEFTGTHEMAYTLAWEFLGETDPHLTSGDLTMIGPDQASYVEGDANGDGTVNIADASYIINAIFFGGSQPDPVEAADANCDGNMNIADASYIINSIFFGGSPPGCGR